jgi:hypothetical protein
MIGVVLSIMAYLCFLGAPVLAHFRVLPPTIGLLGFAVGGLIGLAAAGVGVWAAFFRGMSGETVIALAGGVPLLVFVGTAVSAIRYPSINDITTNVADPPAFLHALTLPENSGRDMAFPAAFGPIIARAYPSLASVSLAVPPPEAYARVLREAERQGDWAITRRDPQQFELEAVATTWLYRFQDDIVMRVRSDGDGGSVIDMRSKSRDGKGDIGANAKRIDAFLFKLK